MKTLLFFIFTFVSLNLWGQDVIITNDLETILAKEGSIRELSETYEYIDFYDSGDDKKVYIDKSEVKSVKTSGSNSSNESTNVSRSDNREKEEENLTKKPFGKQRVALSLSGLHFTDHVFVSYERSLVKSDWVYFRLSASVDIGGSLLVPNGGIRNFFYDYNVNGDILWILNRNNKVFRNYIYTGLSYNQFKDRGGLFYGSSTNRTIGTLAYNFGYGIQFKTKLGISPGFYAGGVRHIGLSTDYRQAGLWFTINIGYTF